MNINKSAMSAAMSADWGQVIQNGGPPCFHVEGERFCFRAKRWEGHKQDQKWEPIHKFVPLVELIKALAK